MSKRLIQGFHGLGDNIYQRPFLREAIASFDEELYFETPWPELYSDMPELKLVKPETKYRTQSKNLGITKTRWHPRPKLYSGSVTKLHYGAEDMDKGSLIKAFERSIPIKNTEFKMDLPNMGPCPIECPPGKKGIAVVRPATVRREWVASTRNAKPEYIAWCAKQLMQEYHVVSVADVDGRNEWICPPAPPAHVRLERGELDVSKLLALIQHAKLAVGGVGWILPACIAAKTPLFCILGGRGAFDTPAKITDPRMDLSKLHWAKPDRHCPCPFDTHDCDKTVSKLPQAWEHFMRTFDGQNN